jgi:transposase InsO family protein
MCTLAGFSRSGYYRSLIPALPASQEELKLRDALHKVALEWPAYGSRRMAKELRKQGWEVNRKRLQRLMREDNLLCVAKRKFVVTTDSGHPLPVYPNLPPTMKVTGLSRNCSSVAGLSASVLAFFWWAGGTLRAMRLLIGPG